MNITVIISGGVGERFGSSEPKQYVSLLGKSIIEYVIETAKKSVDTDRIVIAAALEYHERFKQYYGVECCASGETHNKTVRHAIDYIAENYADCKKVCFVDSVRPFVTPDLIDTHFGFLDDYDAVITAQKITDSLGNGNRTFVNRDDYFLIQKPESFKFTIIKDSFSDVSQTTAVVQQMPAGSRIKNFFWLENNLKITYPQDLLIAQALMEYENLLRGGAI